MPVVIVRKERPVRLPLQIGTSSLWSFTRAAATIGPMLILFAVPLGFLLSLAVGLWYLGAVLAVLGILLFLYVQTHLALGWAGRPSDAVLSAAALRVEGGPHHGLDVAWSDVALDETAVIDAKDRRLVIADGDVADRDVEVTRLQLALRDGRKLVLAVAELPIEKASLRALYATIVARVSGDEPAPAEVPESARVLACPGCNAIAAPDDVPVIHCAYCGATLDVPDELRGRVRAERLLVVERRSTDRLVARLLDQKGAARAAVTMGLATVPMLLAATLAFLTAAGMYLLAMLRFGATFWLIVFAELMVFGLFFLARGSLTDRHALRLLTLDFAAIAPVRPGAPHACHQCGAPLPEVDAEAVVRCLHCATPNILGLDLRGRASRERGQIGSLDEALRQRRAEQWRWRGLGLAAIPLLGAAALALRFGLAPAHDLRTTTLASRLTRVSYSRQDEFAPALSPDGQTLLFDGRVMADSSHYSESAIFGLPPGGGLFRTRYTPAGLFARFPAWIPDGSGFVYSAQPKQSSQLVQAGPKPSTTEGRILLETPEIVARPAVFPGGLRFLFVERAQITRLDAGAPERRSRLAGGGDPAVSPDGKHVAMRVSRASSNHLQIVAVEGGKTTQLMSDDALDKEPAWSPDGRYLVFVSTRDTPGDGTNLFVVRPDGTGLVALTAGDAEVRYPCWGRDGWIYFSSNRDGQFDIWRIKPSLP